MVKKHETSISEQIFDASKKGNKEELIQLLKTKNIKKYFNYKEKGTKNSALHIAIANGNNECVELLIKSGFNINILNNDNLTPLHISVKVNSAECTKILTKYGVNINTQTKITQSTALHYACNLGNTNIVAILLDNGADKYINNNTNQAPIMSIEHIKETNINTYYTIYALFIINGFSHIIYRNLKDKENIVKRTLDILNVIMKEKTSINKLNNIILSKINEINADNLYSSYLNYRNTFHMNNRSGNGLNLIYITKTYINSSILKNIITRMLSVSTENMIYAIEATKMNNIITRKNTNEVKKTQYIAILKIGIVGNLINELNKINFINSEFDKLLLNRIDILHDKYKSLLNIKF